MRKLKIDTPFEFLSSNFLNKNFKKNRPYLITYKIDNRIISILTSMNLKMIMIYQFKKFLNLSKNINPMTFKKIK